MSKSYRQPPQDHADGSAGELVEAMVPITTHDGLADAFFFSRLLVSNILAMKDGQPYALAGLWEKWKDRKAGTELLTFTVITTDPNSVVEPLHNRMLVIVPERDYDRWLRAEPDRPPIDLLRPFEADKMTAWKVDTAVGNVKNDRPELIGPGDVR